MRRFQLSIAMIALPATIALVQTPSTAAAQAIDPLVEFEMMTWPEVKQALVSG
jgi:hypothetical protein